VTQKFELSADFIMSMGIYTDRDQEGDVIVTDVLFGAELVGQVIYNVKVQAAVEVR